MEACAYWKEAYHLLHNQLRLVPIFSKANIQRRIMLEDRVHYALPEGTEVNRIAVCGVPEEISLYWLIALKENMVKIRRHFFCQEQ